MKERKERKWRVRERKLGIWFKEKRRGIGSKEREERKDLS